MKTCKDVQVWMASQECSEDQPEFQRHLENCAACRRFQEDTRRIAAAIRQIPVEIPPFYGSQLVVRLNERRDRRRMARRRIWSLGPVFVSTILLVALMVWRTGMLPSAAAAGAAGFSEHDEWWMNLTQSGYLSEMVAGVDANGLREMSFDARDMDQAAARVLLLSANEPLVNACVVATRSMDDAEFEALLQSMQKIIL